MYNTVKLVPIRNIVDENCHDYFVDNEHQRNFV
jgi:hypothetical protein